MAGNLTPPDRVWKVQSLYFVMTGIWPLIGLKSFMRITGPKTDTWLVRCVGALVTVIGTVIGVAGSQRQLDPSVVTLAVGASASLAAIDVVYSVSGRISKVYLLDAGINTLFVAAWTRRARATSTRG